jgi:hypothetical protein
MRIIQDGREILIRWPRGAPPRATLTLPPPYEDGEIEVSATDCAIDIEPLGVSLEVGQQVYLEANPEWRSVEYKLSCL